MDDNIPENDDQLADAENAALPETNLAPHVEAASPPTSTSGMSADQAAKRVIKIGSQRSGETTVIPPRAVAATEPPESPPPASVVAPPTVSPADVPMAPPPPAPRFPPPRVDRLSEDLQKEIDDALADVSLDELLGRSTAGGTQHPELQPDGRYEGTIVKVHREDVFVSLPGRNEGIVPLKQFKTDPVVGATMEVTVVRYNAEEGIFELSIPGASIDVGDWSDIEEGVVVAAKVTGHNTGGLECEVNGIRGFIPISQIDVVRVEDLAQFENEKFDCIVTEANPDRRNLVLSRRAVLERERAEQREQLIEALEVGQVREGIVRSIRDFGAFVDLGGIDGLVHVSKLSWDRVNHPSEVLAEGQKVKVVIEKIDPTTGKLSLSYRDTIEDPWATAEQQFPANTITEGVVTKIMDFGAFVRLAAGLEGLIHISELAHHRVSRVDSVVNQGDHVQVKVLSIDPDKQRMSLSMKAIQAAPVKAAKGASEEIDEPLRDKATKPRQGPLKGGTNRRTGGDQFGLNW